MINSARPGARSQSAETVCDTALRIVGGVMIATEVSPGRRRGARSPRGASERAEPGRVVVAARIERAGCIGRVGHGTSSSPGGAARRGTPTCGKQPSAFNAALPCTQRRTIARPWAIPACQRARAKRRALYNIGEAEYQLQDSAKRAHFRSNTTLASVSESDTRAPEVEADVEVLRPASAI